jgi:hypothetical protein
MPKPGTARLAVSTASGAVKSTATSTFSKVTAGITGVASGADVIEGNGLDRASAAAGDVLNATFGALPWDLSPGAIVDAVTILL